MLISEADIIKILNLGCGNSSLCEKLGRNGHKLANEIYNWEKQAENLIDLYHSIS